jgi:hypothetical protein
MLSPQGAVSVFRRPLLKSEKWRTRPQDDITTGRGINVALLVRLVFGVDGFDPVFPILYVILADFPL